MDDSPGISYSREVMILFCPSCHNMVTEIMLIKSNARFMPGNNAPVEYDARCPFCKEEIGRMSWGQLTIPPELKEKFDAAHGNAAGRGKLADTDRRPVPAEPESGEGQESGVKRCPHCGGILPEDI